MGRTGKLFAHEHAGIVPDAISARQRHRRRLPHGRDPRARGSGPGISPPAHTAPTFGGNPLACAAANAVLDVILAPGFLDAVCRQRGASLRAGLTPPLVGTSLRVRGSPRDGSDAWPEMPRAERQRTAGLHGGRASHRSGRRQRAAPGAAACRHGGGSGLGRHAPGCSERPLRGLLANHSQDVSYASHGRRRLSLQRPTRRLLPCRRCRTPPARRCRPGPYQGHRFHRLPGAGLNLARPFPPPARTARC